MFPMYTVVSLTIEDHGDGDFDPEEVAGIVGKDVVVEAHHVHRQEYGHVDQPC
jgi:hypothetical protein